MCPCAVQSLLKLMVVSCMHAARPDPTNCFTGDRPPGSEVTCLCVYFCVCAVYMGIHASTQHGNPAAFVFLTCKLQNDPFEELLPQQAMHPSAPPSCSWAACVSCVCECLQPVCKCKCVCVCERAGSLSLALEVNRKRRRDFFLPSGCKGSGGRGGHIMLFFLIAVGAFWRGGGLNLDAEEGSCIVSPY